MVIVGGAGTLIGPILGGVSFVFLEHQLSQVTDLWPLIAREVESVYYGTLLETLDGPDAAQPPTPDGKAPGAG